MVIIKAGTAKAKDLIKRCRNFEGYELEDIYTTWSNAKGHAFAWCTSEYLKDVDEGRCTNTLSFHICSHNKNTFSVAWECIEYWRLETAYNTYIIMK